MSKVEFLKEGIVSNETQSSVVIVVLRLVSLENLFYFDDRDVR
jgi:hypothetical protein